LLAAIEACEQAFGVTAIDRGGMRPRDRFGDLDRKRIPAGAQHLVGVLPDLLDRLVIRRTHVSTLFAPDAPYLQRRTKGISLANARTGKKLQPSETFQAIASPTAQIRCIMAGRGISTNRSS
jgi:hypothetical protein